MVMRMVMAMEGTDLVNFSWPLVQAVSPLSSLGGESVDIDEVKQIRYDFDELAQEDSPSCRSRVVWR
jgi:hypothetical protein